MQNVFGNESVFNFDKCQREEIPKEPLQDSTDTPNDALIPVTIVSVLLVVSLLLISVVGIALYARYRHLRNCLLYTSPSPRDRQKSRMPSSA